MVVATNIYREAAKLSVPGVNLTGDEETGFVVFVQGTDHLCLYEGGAFLRQCDPAYWLYDKPYDITEEQVESADKVVALVKRYGFAMCDLG